MDPPDLEPRDALAVDPDDLEAALLPCGEGPHRDGVGSGWLEEIVARLEEDPEECWPAIEALSEVEEEVRRQVLGALVAYRDRPGVHRLLHLLERTRDPVVKEAGTSGFPQDLGPADVDRRRDDSQVGCVASVPIPASAILPVLPVDGGGRDPMVEPGISSARIVRSLVAALDGEGGGMIIVSTTDQGYRRTAAFRCNVRRGLLDVAGEVEKEHPSAGRLLDEWIHQAEGDFVLDVPELAVRLLAGSLRLSRHQVPSVVRAWLDATIGPGALSAGLPTAFPIPVIQAIADVDLAARANLVLDACPDWLDRSALTYELGEEIALREGETTPDPLRDGGAYRYLFEHRLIGRLDLYARMLLWMGWVWDAAGRVELSRSAFALAGELSDEQHAVPSHPFTVSLTTRSLQAAQAELLRAAPRG
jgi:hypothetical protein